MSNINFKRQDIKVLKKSEMKSQKKNLKYIFDIKSESRFRTTAAYQNIKIKG